MGPSLSQSGLLIEIWSGGRLGILCSLRLEASLCAFATENSGTFQTSFIRHVAPVSATAVERPPGLAPVVRHLPPRQTVNPTVRGLISELEPKGFRFGSVAPSSGAAIS
jgi:hypothetical protein